MPKLLKCPHCATSVEYGVSVCKGCSAQVTYWTAEGKVRVALTFWTAVPAILCFAAVFGTAIWLFPDSKSNSLVYIVGVLGLIAALAGGLTGYRFACRLAEGHKLTDTVTFRRRYPDDTEKVVSIEIL